MTPTFRDQLASDTIAIIKQIARETGLSQKKIHRHGSKDRRYRNARCQVAQRLKKLGYEPKDIALPLGVDLDTVRFLLRGERDHQQMA